jgi:hypothetical protein
MQMTPSELLAELHESLQRQKRLLRRLRLLEAVRLGQVADQLTEAQWNELDLDADSNPNWN